MEQGQSIQANKDEVDSTGHIRVDEEKTKQALKVVQTLQFAVITSFSYFAEKQEEQMKLIIGEKLMDIETKRRLLQEIQSADSELTYEEMQSVLARAGLVFAEKIVQCCFIFLLKKTSCLWRVKRADFQQFVHQIGEKATDFSATGANFPVETDLAYSSDGSDNAP